jgi:hypothetical protein
LLSFISNVLLADFVSVGADIVAVCEESPANCAMAPVECLAGFRGQLGRGVLLRFRFFRRQIIGSPFLVIVIADVTVVKMASANNTPVAKTIVYNHSSAGNRL